MSFRFCNFLGFPVKSYHLHECLFQTPNLVNYLWEPTLGNQTWGPTLLPNMGPSPWIELWDLSLEPNHGSHLSDLPWKLALGTKPMT